MILLEQWKEMLSSQTDDTFPEFWETYSSTEKRIYSSILDDFKTPISGSFSELKDRFETTDVLFMGFLDGINSSLKKELPLEDIDDDAPVDLDIDHEKLYFNMLAAGADYLYQLPQWQSILSPEKIEEITKAYKKSKTVIKGEQIGRNDPCPCGSGKKYKKCCGA